MDVPEINVTDLSGDEFLLDVREDSEWRAGHIASAAHIAMSSVPTRMSDVPREARVAVICRSGMRSAQVTAFLVQQGFDAVNIAGGMQAWASRGGVMVGEADAPPQVI